MPYEVRMVTRGDFKVPMTAPKQKCDECGDLLEPIFKATRKAEDWFWTECEKCGEPICEGCSDVDSEGVRICVTCASVPTKE